MQSAMVGSDFWLVMVKAKVNKWTTFWFVNCRSYLHHSDDLHTVLVKTVTTVVTTKVLDSTICVYTSVVPVNMLQVYTLGCYYWRWYLGRDEAVNRYQQQQQQSAIITVDIVLSLRDGPWSMPWRRAKEAIRLRPYTLRLVTDNYVGGG